MLSPEALDRFGLGMVTAVAGVVLVCALHLPAQDTSAAAQAFFAIPVFWTASSLRAAGVALVTAMPLAAGRSDVLPSPAAGCDPGRLRLRRRGR
jgi:hypothetical protein